MGSQTTLWNCGQIQAANEEEKEPPPEDIQIIID